MWVVYLAFMVGAYTIWRGIKDYRDIIRIKQANKLIVAKVMSIGEMKEGMFYYRLSYTDATGDHEMRYPLPRFTKKKNLLPAGAEAKLFIDPNDGDHVVLENKKKEMGDLRFNLMIGALVFAMAIVSLMEIRGI